MIDESVRAALLYVLWHHQGGSSDVGQPIRLMLGLGQHERMSERQVAEARLVQSALAAQAKPSTPAGFDVHLDAAAVETLNVYSDKETDADEWPALRLQLGDGHSGHGLYLSLSEYPEEGAEFLAAIPSPAPTP